METEVASSREANTELILLAAAADDDDERAVTLAVLSEPVN